MNEHRPRAHALALSSVVLLLLVGCGSTRSAKVDREQRLSVHTESAALYINMGEFERAVDQAQRGLELDPDNFTLRLYLGRALQKIGGTNEILVAERVYRSMPGDRDFRVPLGLGEVLERKGMAQDEAAEAIASGKRYTQATDRAARAAELRAESVASWKESEVLYERALKLQPGDLEVLSGLARINALQGEHGPALEWAEVLLTTLASDRSFWRQQLEVPNLGPGDQQRILSQVRTLDDLAITVRRKAAALELELRRPERALLQLDAVLEVDPNIKEVHAMRGQLLASLGRHREAIVAIDRYLELGRPMPFEHPDVQRAYRLRTAWSHEAEQRETGTADAAGPAAAPRR